MYKARICLHIRALFQFFAVTFSLRILPLMESFGTDKISAHPNLYYLRAYNFAVVIPMANEEPDFFPFVEALTQVLNFLQSGKVYFVVDEVSKDKTRDLCTALSEKDPSQYGLPQSPRRAGMEAAPRPSALRATRRAQAQRGMGRPQRNHIRPPEYG